ncbi:unnamed protein product [Triticum turgidum subsp. durum]|uniref:Leucine-rich repeat-containing N-terminal plant-type domain-containing protein n=1 Tax=Triticum turgidum subsp. durum TaxID=4567 RepID=A0A9R0XVS7_TRITD|nr:unnamed protein product [Triticum turgidum subsp. durum]
MLMSLAAITSSCTEQEKASLLKFLTGLSQDGGLAASWRNGTDCCTWEGITCSMDGTVTDVSLASKGLQGYISPTVGSLAGLLRLNLSNNMLSSGLPQELVSSGSIIAIDISFNRLDGELHEMPSSTPVRPLKVLNISSNLFAGQFPSSTWGAMKDLVALNASNNSFTGQLPTHFCTSFPSLVVLELSYNRFRGSIPPELGSCSMLRVLKVGHNNLSGTLPDELFNATSLEFLSFPRSGLQGILEDTYIAKLTFLVTLDLGENNFSGKIPEFIGHLKRLEELYLNSNIMYGELPSTLANCTNLITINLNCNNFSGQLTKVNFSSLPNLMSLDLMRNNFDGTIPESIYSCRKLIALRLSSNKFHGQLAKGLGNLKSLSFLSLYNNNLTNITDALQILGSSKNLSTLLIGRNFRHETMPEDDTIGSFENIRFLALSYVFYLDISNNSLTGEIPTTLTDMPMLESAKTDANSNQRVFILPVYPTLSHQYRQPFAFPKLLDLSNNKFTGEIPSTIGQLKSLRSLNLSFNNLTGQIPESTCNLTSLQVLDLSNNNLTGAIPAALDSLHFLAAFNVSDNDLEGPIPSGGQFNTFGTSSFDGNTKLCGSMLIHKCGSAEAPPVNVLTTKQTDYKVAFVIAFSTFFGVGVLYDQIVLSRYFG